MGWLDGLSSALTAGTQGAAGYLAGQDKGRLEAQARARQIALDLIAKHKQETEDARNAFSDSLKASQAGYRPVAGVQKDAATTGGIAATGAAGLSGATGLGGGGLDLSALQNPVAKLAGDRSQELQQGLGQTVTLPNGEKRAFDFDSSLEGRQLKRVEEAATQKSVFAQRQQEAKDALGQAAKERANKAAYGTLVQDFKHSRPYSPDTDYAAALVDARGLRQIGAGQQNWVQAGTDQATGLPLLLNTKDGTTKVGGGIKEGAGTGQTRLPERTQQLGLALHNAVEALPFHDKMERENITAPSAVGSLVKGYLAEKSQAGSQGARTAMNFTQSGQDYERYIDAMNGSLLAVAHSVGGARINREQVLMFGGNMMLTPNDPPETIKQKTRAIIDFMNSARATLPAAAVAQQEASLGKGGLDFLRSKGYGAEPTAAGNALLMRIRAMPGAETMPTDTSPTTPGAKPSLTDRVQQLKDDGVSKDEAKATLRREGYVVP